MPLSGYSPRQRRRAQILGVMVGLVLALLFTFLQDRSWLRFAENLVQRTWMDRYYAVYGAHSEENYVSSSASVLDTEFTERMVLVVFDDSSLRSGLSWPIERHLYKTLIHKLRLAGAETIAFDIMFSGPSGSPEDDGALKEAIRDPHVIMPYGLSGHETRIDKGLLYPPLIEGWSAEDKRQRLGFTMEVSDPIDKRVRLAVLKVSPPTGIEGESHYSLTVVALARYLGISPQELIDRYADRLESTDLTVAGSPYAFNATVGRIAYCGSDLSSASSEESPEEAQDETQLLEGRLGPATVVKPEAKLAKVDVPPISDYIQVWPVQDILNTPDEELKGFFGSSVNPNTGEETPNKVLVLVGVNVPGGYDIKMSDVGSISGVSIHANIVWNLMQGTFLHELSQNNTAIFVILLSLAASLIGTHFEIKWASVMFVLLCGGYWIMGYHLMYDTYFTSGGVIIPIFCPWIGALASFSAVTIRNVLVERNARQTMHDALTDVLPVPDIEDWVNNKGLEIGSEERNLTILFSDIRGYTDLSETLNPVTITEMLNTYHEAMGSIFDHYGGIIFDYQGDAQMVVFGLAPASQPNHAAAAVKAATGMILRLEQLRSEWLAQKRPVFESGIGVCTGQVAIGVVGSKYRKQICAIGDPTNTSARMQGKSKELNCPVLMTESTYKAAGDDIIAHFIQSVSVKGKREPLAVYGVDLEAMRELLKRDGLNINDIVLVLLTVSLRNITGCSDDAVSAQAQIEALNHDLRRLIKLKVPEHNGLVAIEDEELPQATTAFFGWGPFNKNNHALEAFELAKDIYQALKQTNAQRASQGYPWGEPFFCLHTGFTAVTENKNDEDSTYQVAGEAWNTVKHLTSKCQGLSASLIITEDTLPSLSDNLATTVISTFKLPNKKQTLALYGLKDAAALEQS